MQKRELLYSLLGDLPPIDRAVSGRCITTQEHDAMQVEHLTLDLNGEEPVPAYFIYPSKGKGPFPCVLYNHYHAGMHQTGKREVLYLDNPYMPTPYAYDLTAAGYAVLCIDHYNFGERSGRDETALFKELIWQGRVLWGMMVYDSIKAIDYLCTRADVDSRRIGTLGMSMGATMAWWLAALDERVKVCVDLCCMTDFDALVASGADGINGHGIYYYVPSLMKHFTTAQINALIYPRAHLSLNGQYDHLTPYGGLQAIDAELKAVYSDCPDRWRMGVEPHGHMETAKMRVDVLEFLRKQL